MIGSYKLSLTIEVEQEEDGRWLAEVLELPGTLVYGLTREEAIARVKALALRVLAEQIEHGDYATMDFTTISFAAA
jgi:predicted RNase H-like HicB family nuclease